ncbi:MAG: SpoVA/SpoVAEb family sporulation membrane protein [Ruminococcaceae bacterium]|nr:SpoVA/SpoVAEb family sporulation membrane protein [Oscillospiraceae bacterium]
MGFNITNKEYNQKVKEASKNSKLFLDVILAFTVGGIICVIGQIVLNILKMFNFDKETLSSLVCVIMIFIGSFLTAINIYGDIAKFSGAGTLVPITGFANSVVSSAMEFKSEGIILGLGSKMFTIAGPVLVFGVISSVVCGLFYYLYLLIF